MAVRCERFVCVGGLACRRYAVTRPDTGTVVMAIGPRLDLRQTQTLVMTPQLRQAIKLLQYSNVEVASFVEEELERNPLLERDESAELPTTERAAPDQAPERISETADAAQLAQADTLPSRGGRAARCRYRRDLRRRRRGGRRADVAGDHGRPRRRRAISRPTNAASTTWRMNAVRCANISASSFGCRSTIRWTG